MWGKRPNAGQVALVVSLIALVAAIGGTAVGLPGKKTIDRNDLKPNVVKSKHVVDDNLGGGDIDEGSLSQVPSAARAGSAATADSALTANSALSATSAEGPFAFAWIDDASPSTPTEVIEARSKGLGDANVLDSGNSGEVCFDLPFTARGAQVTLDTENAPANGGLAEFNFGDPRLVCPNSHDDAFVATYTTAGSAFDAGFFIIFYR